jgi:hypothetical protein
MGAEVFLSAFGSVMVGWLVHFFWWRLERPKDDLRALAICMCLLPSAVLTAFFLAGWLGGIFLPLLLALALGTAYLFWYPAAQAVSPTMLITLLVREAGDEGVDEEAIRDAIPEKLLSENLIDNLVEENFARRNLSGILELAGRGKRTLAIIRLLRNAAGYDDPRG